MKQFDAHCHIQDKRLESILPAILNSSSPQLPEFLASCGTSENDWPNLEKLALKHERIIPSFGLHPSFIEERSENWLTILESFIQRNEKAGIGEAGLDGAVNKGRESIQEEVFLRQVEMAVKYNRPLSIHCRKAFYRLIPLITQIGPLPRPFLIHSYSGNLQDTDKLVELGAYFSFSGSCTYSNNKRAHKSVAIVPLDRLLIETDCPDMYPHMGINEGTKQNGSSSGKAINVPENLIYVAEKVAEIRQVSCSDIINTTFNNAMRFFFP